MPLAHNPTEAAPHLGRAPRRRLPEVKPQAEPVKINRTIHVRLIMARRTEILADARWAELHVLRARRTAKAIELQTSSPELRNWHARLGYEWGLVHHY
jgi:hypothetical protein